MLKYLLPFFISNIACSTDCSDLYKSPDNPLFCEDLKHSFNITVDKNFSDLEFEKIKIDLNQWTYLTNNYIIFNFTEKCNHIDIINKESLNGISIIKLTYNIDYDQILNIDNITKAKPKGFSNSNKIYLILDRLDDTLFDIAIIHEMGHFLGLNHYDDSISIMFPICDGMNSCIKKYKQPTYIDIQNLMNFYCKK